MVADPLISFHTLLPLLIFSILSQKKKGETEKIQIFGLFCPSVSDVFFELGWARLIYILFQGLALYLKDNKLGHFPKLGIDI